jgi:hypothetical protein
VSDPGDGRGAQRRRLELLEPCLQRAQRSLNSDGKFAPFAAYVDAEDQVRMLPHGRAHEAGFDPVESFTQRLRALVDGDTALATAISYMGWPVSQGDAIVVELEGIGSDAVSAVVEYEPGIGEGFVYATPEFVPGRARIFAA